MFDRAKVAALGAAALGSLALLLCFLVVPFISTEIEKIRLELRQQANTFKVFIADIIAYNCSSKAEIKYLIY